MSDLGLNKILGATLATALAIVGLHEISGMVFEPKHLAECKNCPPIADPKGDQAAAELPIDWGTVLPTADVAAGQSQFAKCAACHTPTAANGIGPGLAGTVGRKPASHPGFAYSPAMTAFAGEHPQWTDDQLDAFLAAPQKHIPGTKMTFVGLKKREDRINVVAYLRSLGSSIPVPAPDPARAAGAPAATGVAAPGAAPAGAPVSTGTTAQVGQPGQAPAAGPAMAPTQMQTPPGYDPHR